MSITARVGSLAIASAALLVAACAEGQQPVPLAPTAPSAAAGAVTGFAAEPVQPGAASERMLFQVRLRPEGDSRAVGVMLFEIVGGYFTARVQAAGLEPLQHIPQHIHVNPTCNPGGGILINLDERLTVAGEGPGVGTAYPVANRGGVVNYQAQRPLAELLNAVNVHLGAGVDTVDELIAFLNLDERNAHMHVPFGPPFPAVNCGEIERLR